MILTPKVSIVTVYYNRQDYVVESISSLLNQTYKDIEIIAVDDGSTDNTYEQLLSIKDSRLKVYTHANKGFVKSVKEAVELYSAGDFIAIHGSGDISLPRRIEKQAKVLEANFNIGVVGCYVDEVNKVTGEIIKRRPMINADSKTKSHDKLTEQIIKSNPFTHGEVMFRRDIYIKAGGYREFFKYSQDRDLWLRMSIITDFHIIKEVFYKRFKLPGGVSLSLDKIILQKYLSDFACQCVRFKLRGEKDLLEAHGEYSPFYRERNKGFAYELFSLAIYAWMHDDVDNAIYINDLSIDEKNIVLNTLFKSILYCFRRFSYTSELARKLLILCGYGKRKFKS